MAKKNNVHKTNAIRIVQAKKIPFEIYEYEAPDGFLDGVSVAKATGQNPDQVFKTLVLQGASRENYVCVIPVGCELNLKKAAKHFGEKKIEMIPHKDITKVTGYIKGGCSPIGMKKQFKTTFHVTANEIPQIIVSAGKIGYQIDLKPEKLIKITNANCADIIKNN